MTPYKVEKACDLLMHHLHATGEELLEKNFIGTEDGEILASVFVVVGPSASELTALVREWAHKGGLKKRAR